MKVLFIGNYTQDLLVNIFQQQLKELNYKLEVKVSGFNQYRQEIINTNSHLYSFSPDVIFFSLDLFMLTEDIIYSKSSNKSNLFEERLNETVQLIDLLADNLQNTQIFIDNFFYYQPVTMGTIEYNSPHSYLQSENIANTYLMNVIENKRNVKVVDVRSLLIKKGTENLIDNRMHYLAKSHWNHNGLKLLSGLYLRYLNAFTGKRKKCIVLDLDNTLWGGIIGDDGIENIKLSNDGEGKAFYDFQRELLKLYDRGIVLAVNSKNTEEIVIETMMNHPYMLLKPEHFISMKVNWNNKAQNLKEIADEINIGLDSIVFLDDSDFEREVISNQFPEVTVPELPKDFSEYPSFIRNLDFFDFLSLTNDDFARNKMYKENLQRDNLKKSNINIEDFYYSLNMVVTIGKIDDFNIPRIAQMTQKTNQFNLRTKRYTDSDIKKFILSENYEVYYLSLADKFGDNGIVGTAIVQIKQNEAFIDSFIFSCRALGRTAETVLINYIIDDIKNQGIRKLVGEYIPTKKNLPCKDFYAQNKFLNTADKLWAIDTENYSISPKPWIKINQN